MYTLTQETLIHLISQDPSKANIAAEATYDPFFVLGIQRTIDIQGANYLNIDVQDFEFVLKPTGTALVGVAEGHGPDRATEAIQKAFCPSPAQKQALASPIKIILGITTHQEAQLEAEELDVISDYLEQVLGEYSDITFGMGVDEALATDSVRIVIALSCLQGELV